MKIPRGWFTAGSSEELWGREGFATYAPVPVERLPRIEGLDGRFGWLTKPPPEFTEVLRFEQQPFDSVAPLLQRLEREAESRGFALPRELVTFASTPELHQRVPTCTSCYLDLSERLVELPGDDDVRLVRFMNDQQACLLWYVMLERNGGHSIISAFPEWKEEEVEEQKGKTLDDVVVPREVVVCGASFEEFMKRFWLENSICYAGYEKREPTGEAKTYSEAALRSRMR